MLELRNLCKEFVSKRKKFTVLDSISFTAKPGQVIALIGGNGAGKTTLMRTIATAYKPASGDILLDGTSLVRYPDQVRSKISLLPAGNQLYHRLTPKEILDFFGRLYHMDERTIEQRTQELSEFLNLGHFMDKPIDQLSKGMQQRVAIAKTVLVDPKVLLFDEPTSGLDVFTAKSFIKLVKTLQRKDRVIFISTHNMTEVHQLCDRVLFLDGGQLAFDGSIDEFAKGQESIEEKVLKTFSTK